MVDKVEATDPTTVVFRLKFATDAFLPALADPYAWIYSKAKLDKDTHWYEKNIVGSGPFKFAAYETGQSINGVRNPDYYHKGCPISTASRASTPTSRSPGSRRSAATAPRSSSAAFRPPCATNWSALGDKITVQTSDWNCGSVITINQEKAVRRRARRRA